jgi:PAS domain S-box-containing protein
MAKINSSNNKAEQSFRESEEKLRSLLDSLSVCISYFDKEQRYQFNNKTYEEWFGVSHEEVRGKHIRQVLGEKTYESVRRHIEKALAGQKVNYNAEIQHKDGGKRIAEVNLIPHFNENSDVAGCFIHVEDITGRKLKAETLEMMKFSIDNSSDRIVWVAPDGHILYVNETVCKETGYSREVALSMKVSDVDPNYPADRWAELYKEIKKRGHMRFETRNTSKDGQIQFVEIYAKYLEFNEKEFICSFCRDITERKRLEEKMQMMKFSIDHALDRVAWIAPDGQFLYANEAAYKEMGYSREEFLSLKVSDLDPDYPPEVWAEHYKKLKKRGSFRVDTRHISKDGQIQFIEVSANRMEFEGKEFLCSFGRDMTERKKAEENLQKAYDEIKLLKERLEVENIYLRDQISVQSTHKDILGKSDAMKYVLYKIKQVAPSDSTVLILGETGTGKELVAEAVHSESSRRNRPLVKVNCAALPSNLIESELFGREKGAFTGSQAKQIGRFELADKGTIFLDEVGELPLELQAKLLRVIQSGEFERLGSPHTIKIDVRIIASTNRKLINEVKEGRFREDLYYRLNVFPITVPPLRERKEDIPMIVNFFLKKFGKKIGKQIRRVPYEVIKALQEYHWPGNVRELENITERSMIISPNSTLHLADKLETSKTTGHRTSQTKSLSNNERDHILRVLEQTRWKIDGKNGAAEVLDLNPSTLRTRMRKLGIKRSAQSE